MLLITFECSIITQPMRDPAYYLDLVALYYGTGLEHFRVRLSVSASAY